MGQAEAKMAKDSRRKIVEEAEHRMFVVAYEEALGNAEYKKYVERIIELEQKIIKHLGPHVALFTEYENLVGLSGGIYIENVYLVGLEDGKKLALKSV